MAPRYISPLSADHIYVGPALSIVNFIELNHFDATPGHDGKRGDDNIKGTAGNDVIYGDGGMDIIRADAGNDRITLGSNPNSMEFTLADAGAGNDLVMIPKGVTGIFQVATGTGADHVRISGGDFIHISDDRVRGDSADTYSFDSSFRGRAVLWDIDAADSVVTHGNWAADGNKLVNLDNGASFHGPAVTSWEFNGLAWHPVIADGYGN